MGRIHHRQIRGWRGHWLGVAGAIAVAGCMSPITVREAVQQAEDTFIAHRSEFEQLAETALIDLEQSDESSLKLPDRSFYDSAWVSASLNSDAIDVEFVIEEFYLPLVYISTDNPQDVHDTCTNGGKALKQLAPHWYICKRDWN
jgi:hypothetical protein